MFKKKLIKKAISLLILFTLLSFSLIKSKFENKINSSVKELTYAKVIKVIDGDTIEIEGGQKVRYIGINTPETSDPRKPVECFAKEAKKKNAELVLGKMVRMEKDISEKDKYQRLLRYVYLEDLLINEELVKQGFAYAVSYPPDIKYQEIFQKAEREARENHRGLWKECK